MGFRCEGLGTPSHLSTVMTTSNQDARTPHAAEIQNPCKSKLTLTSKRTSLVVSREMGT